MRMPMTTTIKLFESLRYYPKRQGDTSQLRLIKSIGKPVLLNLLVRLTTKDPCQMIPNLQRGNFYTSSIRPCLRILLACTVEYIINEGFGFHQTGQTVKWNGITFAIASIYGGVAIMGYLMLGGHLISVYSKHMPKNFSISGAMDKS